MKARGTKEREANDMAGLKKLVAVTLAVTLVAVFAAYLLRPNAGSNTGTVVVNEPPAGEEPTDDPGDEPTDDPGDDPTDVPAPPEHGLYAQNSNGPKHEVCLRANPNVPEHAQDEGANRFRGTCLNFPGGGPW